MTAEHVRRTLRERIARAAPLDRHRRITKKRIDAARAVAIRRRATR